MGDMVRCHVCGKTYHRDVNPKCPHCKPNAAVRVAPAPKVARKKVPVPAVAKADEKKEE